MGRNLPRGIPAGFFLDETTNTLIKGMRPNTPKATLPELVKGKGKQKGQMNQTERILSLILRAEHPGAIIEYEALTFRSKGSNYTPDFMVLYPERHPFFYECKGTQKWEKDLIRMRTAAETHPFRFIMAEKLEGGEWRYNNVRGRIDLKD